MHVYVFLCRQADDQTRIGEGLLPWYLQELLQRIKLQPQIQAANERECAPPPNQLTVNEYARGVGLAPHVDTHSAFAGALLSLTTSGHTVMEFRRDKRRKALLLPRYVSTSFRQTDPISCASILPLVRRSLLVLEGEARYGWQHYIPSRKHDYIEYKIVERPERRLSFTFRSLRNGPCTCSFPEYCDSQNADT